MASSARHGAAYVALLVHPIMLAGASLPHAPKEAWAVLSPLGENGNEPNKDDGDGDFGLYASCLSRPGALI